MNNNKKVLLIFLGLSLLFCFFLYFIFGKTGPLKEYADRIDTFTTANSVVVFYNSLPDEVKSNKELKKLFVQKLEKFDLNQAQIDDYTLIFHNPVYYNLIIVPDLSNRIMDSVPSQIEEDKKVILYLYDCMVKMSERNNKKRIKKDLLSIALTNSYEQTDGAYTKLASTLTLDLSMANAKFPQEYIQKRRNEFSVGLDSIYDMAFHFYKQKPSKDKTQWIGNNFVAFFRDGLKPVQLRKNTLTERWINKIVIITDGYLEYKEGDDSFDLTSADLSPTKNPFPSIGKNKFKNADILLCEFQMRIKDKRLPSELKLFWKNWFQDMGFKNVNNEDVWCSTKNPNMKVTFDEIDRFMEIDNSKVESKNIEFEESTIKDKGTNVTVSIPEKKTELTSQLHKESTNNNEEFHGKVSSPVTLPEKNKVNKDLVKKILSKSSNVEESEGESTTFGKAIKEADSKLIDLVNAQVGDPEYKSKLISWISSLKRARSLAQNQDDIKDIDEMLKNGQLMLENTK